MTAIEWTDVVWNPVTGCTKVSPGCAHCYAETQAIRFWKTQCPRIDVWRSVERPDHSVTHERIGSRPRDFTDVQCHADRLEAPLHWRKPRRIFVNSMSDLFHEAVPDAFIDQVFAVMALAPQHTFQILTKRAERMCAYLTAQDVRDRVGAAAEQIAGYDTRDMLVRFWPLPNVWVGVSVENQPFADERIPLLLQTPAAVRWISAEPLLGPILLDNGDTSWLSCRSDMTEERYEALSREAQSDHHCCESWDTRGQHFRGLDWVVVGGESGAGARPLNVAWARSLVRQCQSSRVPVFVKQLGADVRDRNDAGFEGDEHGEGPTGPEWPEQFAVDDRIDHDLDGTRDGYQGAPVRIHLHNRKGGDPSEWPEDLRVREYPEGRR